MSTCLDIVRRALRLVAGEAGVPDGQEGQDALERLQSIVLDLPGLTLNGEWREKAISTAFTACEGWRYTVTAPGAVSLPTTITEDGCTRGPRDLARVQIIGADNAGLYVFSATLGAWGRVDDLTLSGDLPFGPEDDEGLACQLAVALVDEYGGEVSARTVQVANRSSASFRSRFKKYPPSCHQFRDYC